MSENEEDSFIPKTFEEYSPTGNFDSKSINVKLEQHIVCQSRYKVRAT